MTIKSLHRHTLRNHMLTGLYTVGAEPLQDTAQESKNHYAEQFLDRCGENAKCIGVQRMAALPHSALLYHV